VMTRAFSPSLRPMQASTTPGTPPSAPMPRSGGVGLA
jgi:hypothetical protein